MTEKDTPKFSIVLPVYNEAENIPLMAESLLEAGAKLEASFEILWVNDGSDDATEDVLEALAADDARHRVFHFSRNFGHMAALTAGLELAKGSGAVICLDADGQHPPELIPELVARWRGGADVVQALRDDRGGGDYFKRVMSKAFYRILNFLADLELPPGASDFRLLDRQVVDALNGLPERVRFIRGLVYWAGYHREEVSYIAPPRLNGKSKYGLFKMLCFALNGITSFSHRPLRLAFLAGALVSFAAALYAAFVLWCYFTGVELVAGWASTLLALLLLSSVQLFTLGIVGEYVSRLFFEQKHRPIYLLRKPRSETRNGR